MACLNHNRWHWHDWDFCHHTHLRRRLHELMVVLLERCHCHDNHLFRSGRKRHHRCRHDHILHRSGQFHLQKSGDSRCIANLVRRTTLGCCCCWRATDCTNGCCTLTSTGCTWPAGNVSVTYGTSLLSLLRTETTGRAIGEADAGEEITGRRRKRRNEREKKKKKENNEEDVRDDTMTISFCCYYCWSATGAALSWVLLLLLWDEVAWTTDRAPWLNQKRWRIRDETTAACVRLSEWGMT